MSPRIPCAALCLLALTGSACSRTGFSVQAQSHAVTGRDGVPISVYEITADRRVVPESAGTVLYILGSDYAWSLKHVEAATGALLLGWRVFLVERRGIAPDGTVDLAECHRCSAKSIRVQDHLDALNWILEVAPARTVLLVGASEGGDVAASVAEAEPRVTHLALLSCGGGMSQAAELEWMVAHGRGNLGVLTVEALRAVFDKIRAEPDSLALWAGHPYRRWSSYLWDPPIDHLKPLAIPVFVAHGREDDAVPVESARALRDRFLEWGKRNLTYHEYPTGNHSLIDRRTGRSLRPQIELDVLRWLAETGAIATSEQARAEESVRRAHPEEILR